jgi:hypothetical protein
MIRFLADASLREAIVRGCRRREPGMDFLSANDAKLEGVPDPDVLRMAAEQKRVLVTHDFKTMPRHFAEFIQAHSSSPGVILVPQYLPIGQAIADLALIWAVCDPEEWQNRIAGIPI